MNAAIPQLKSYQRSRGEAIDMHTSEDVCALLMPVTEGAAQVTRKGRKLFSGALRPGMLRLSVPEERSQTVFVAPLQQLELIVPGDTLRRAFSEAGYLWPAEPVRFTPLVRPHPVVATLAAAFAAASQLSSPQREAYLEGLVQALLANLVDCQHFNLPINDHTRLGPLDDASFARCVEFADANLEAKLNVRDWAAVLDLGTGEFARAFRKRTGKSPYAWFVDRRIDFAKRLLAENALSLADIALRAGFCSQSHFTASFRQRVGCSPARWALSFKTNAMDYETLS
ncbi:AraC family transcriptional regulator [Paraburkholderia sp. DHOC27]|uniref:helix-turn-helix domain-containing protein n=1 Tax=Paraburkholderia sp. DHOC27 TaxID=2303330 RepID=UPI000E3D37AE|nr:AraC family transcriptional regulator [Paraburkholderia sp. DHOC27]RFU44879.1 AraC family transcriptional regulator [Paraburkholderia sp. DHOC27]